MDALDDMHMPNYLTSFTYLNSPHISGFAFFEASADFRFLKSILCFWLSCLQADCIPSNMYLISIFWQSMSKYKILGHDVLFWWQKNILD